MASERITICIPHWQVLRSIKLCLRSVRKHSRKYDIEIIVVDNGSKDESLDYLRNLSWIQLIERPDESPDNWPRNVFTAWDRGMEEAAGDYYLTMHSDVWVKADDWLDPFLKAMRENDNVAGVGAWKLTLEHPLYAWEKRIVGYINAYIKYMLGRKRRPEWREGHYPRDYCAMYRTSALREAQMHFNPLPNVGGGGRTIAKLIRDAGYDLHMIPVPEMARKIAHIAHGTAAISAETTLNHRQAQRKVERRTEALLKQPWVRALETDNSLDQ